MYANSEIKRIHKENDIVSLISELVKLKKQGNTLYGFCPFHKEDTPSFTVNAKAQTFHCYGCGAGGNVFSFVMQRDKCSFAEAVEKLATRAGLPAPANKKDAAVEKKKERLYRINEIACEYFEKNGQQDADTIKYLKDVRKLSDETIRAFRLGKSGGFGQTLYRLLKSKGFTNEELLESGLIGFGEVYKGNDKKEKDYYDKFRNRVMFPIFNKDNNIVGFGGRILGGDGPKYINSPETFIFDKSHELYGLSVAKDQKKSLILCEGYLDVISMHQAGFKTAVASLGTALTVAQCQMIAKYTDTVFIAYDSDDPGKTATTRAIPFLEAAGLKVFVISTEPYKDVDELLHHDDANATMMKKRFKKAIPGKTFLVRQLDKNDPSYFNKAVDYLV